MLGRGEVTEMALPTSRDITLTSASPAPSNLLNKLQDMVIGNKKPSTTRQSMPFFGSGKTGTWNELSNYVQSTIAAGFQMPLLMEAGDRLTAVTIAAYGDGAVDCAFSLFAITPANAVTTLVNAQQDTNRAAAWGDVSLVLSPSTYVMGAGEALILTIGANAANYRVGPIRWTYDRL